MTEEEIRKRKEAANKYRNTSTSTAQTTTVSAPVATVSSSDLANRKKAAEIARSGGDYSADKSRKVTSAESMKKYYGVTNDFNERRQEYYKNRATAYLNRSDEDKAYEKLYNQWQAYQKVLDATRTHVQTSTAEERKNRSSTLSLEKNLKEELKSAYIGVYGNDVGFDKWLKAAVDRGVVGFTNNMWNAGGMVGDLVNGAVTEIKRAVTGNNNPKTWVEKDNTREMQLMYSQLETFNKQVQEYVDNGDPAQADKYRAKAKELKEKMYQQFLADNPDSEEWNAYNKVVSAPTKAIDFAVGRIAGPDNWMEEYAKSKSNAQTTLRNAENEYNKLANGNVDYSKRPYISPEKMAEKGWDIGNNDVATTLTQSVSIGEDNNKYTILVTPIKDDGTVLTPEELDQYISTLNIANGTRGVLNDDKVRNSIVIGIVPGWDEHAFDEFEEKTGPLKNAHAEATQALGRYNVDDENDPMYKVYNAWKNAVSASNSFSERDPERYKYKTYADQLYEQLEQMYMEYNNGRYVDRDKGFLTAMRDRSNQDQATIQNRYQQLLEYQQMQSNKDNGKAWEVAGDVVTGTVQAAMYAALGFAGAVATAGSTATTLAPQVTGLADKVATVLTSYAKSPDFWLSFMTETGSTYKEAREAGANQNVAAFTATITGLINGAIEIGIPEKSMGGIQGLPKRLLNKGENATRWSKVADWVESALGEGKEEILQGIVSNLAEKFAYNKSKKWYGEGGVFDPQALGKEGLMGMGVGGILGGIQSGGATIYNNAVQNRVNAENAKFGARYMGKSDTIVENGLKMPTETKSYELASKLATKEEKPTDAEIGELYKQMIADSGVSDMSRTNLIAAAKQRLEELGETADTRKIAECIAKAAYGGTLTSEESRILNGSKYGERVVNELVYSSLAPDAFSSKWAQDLAEQTAESQINAKPELTQQEKAEQIEELKNPKTAETAAANIDETIEQMAARYGKEANVFKEAVGAAKPRDIYKFDTAYNTVYQLAKSGLDKANVMESMSMVRGRAKYTLTAEQFNLAYESGIRASVNQKGTKFKKTATVKLEGMTADELRTKLNDKQNAAYRVLSRLAKLTGVDIVLFESTVDDKGRYVGYQGKYENGKIYIDINAGLKLKSDAAELASYAMLRVASHEYTHYLQRNAAKEYADLKNAVFENLQGFAIEGKYYSANEWVNAKIREAKKAGYELSYEDAVDECVADACEMMMKDSTAFETLAQENPSVAQKILNWLKDFIDDIKAAFAGVNAESTEAQAMIGDLERIQKLWDAAMVQAVRSSKLTAKERAELNAAGVDASEEFASVYSIRYLLEEDEKANIAKSLSKAYGVTEEEAKSWINAETSMASIILNPKYSAYLDYEADTDEDAIKSNSDYPQGTIDFSNICPKRRDFTNVISAILRQFPNHVFMATDLARIRTIMEEEGLDVACAICYVEDRRQRDTIVAAGFLENLRRFRNGETTDIDGKAFSKGKLKAFNAIKDDTYTPTIYELASLDGLNELKQKDPMMRKAWETYNNARGMQSVRLPLNDAEYKRQILKYTERQVKSKNDHGGLRAYSFSDLEMYHLIDIIQIIIDSSAVGLSIQGYTKVNEYAKAVKDTGLKLNRSLIPAGKLGYHLENGKVVLDYDTKEGIDINHPDFFDNRDNPNVGNILIGINETQIRAAMVSDFVDQIIPFHTSQSEAVLKEKGVDEWDNFKDSQTEKDLATGTVSEHQINIYTEVIQVLEREGKEINKHTFIEKFLDVCKENGLKPRFAEFLNTDEEGNYIYTEGYHKFLVDFKTFAQTEVGEYLPQMPVKPIFNEEYIAGNEEKGTKGILQKYVDKQKENDAKITEKMPRVLERIEDEIINESEKTQLKNRTDVPTARELLSGALMSIAETDAEKAKLQDYQRNLKKLNETQEQVDELGKQIHDIMFTKGSDRSKLAKLEAKKAKLEKSLSWYDNHLMNLQNTKPLKDLLNREKKRVAREQKAATLEDVRNRAETKAIRNKIKDLKGKWQKGVDSKNNALAIPANLKSAVINMLNLIDTTTSRTSRSAYEQIAIVKARYEEILQDPDFAGDAAAQNVLDMISELQTAVTDEDGNSIKIYDMTYSQLSRVYETLKAMNQVIADAKKTKSRAYTQNIYDSAKLAATETNEASPLLKSEKIMELVQWQLDPESFFARMGGHKKNSVWEKQIAASFIEGTLRALRVQRDFENHFEAFKDAPELDRLTNYHKLVDVGLEDGNGDAIKMTRGMMLSLYMHLLAEDNSLAILYGGISFPQLKAYYSNHVDKAYGIGSSIVNSGGHASAMQSMANLAEEMRKVRKESNELKEKRDKMSEDEYKEKKDKLDARKKSIQLAQARLEDAGLDELARIRQNIYDMMTPMERKFTEAVAEWYSTKAKDYANEVTMELFDYKGAEVENYFPMHRNPDFISSIAAAGTVQDLNLINSGFMKERVRSSAPIYLTDIVYELDHSLRSLSKYYGYAIAQRDFDKIYKIRISSDSTLASVVGKKFGEGESTLGVSAEQYIKNLEADITGSREKPATSVGSIIRRNLPRGSLTMNLRVAMSQLASMPTAAAEVGWGPMIKGLAKSLPTAFNKDAKIELAQKSELFFQRYKGEGGMREFADMKGGTNALDRLWNRADKVTKHKLLNWCQNFDTFATYTMWAMAEEWVKENTKLTGAEFDAAVKQKYEDIIRHTQPNYTTTERSDLLRESREAYKLLTMYKTQSNKNFNIMYNANATLRKYQADLKNGKNGVTAEDVKWAKKKFINSYTALFFGGTMSFVLLRVLADFIMGSLRDYRDDDDEITGASFFKSVTKQGINAVAGMFVFGSQISDILYAYITKTKYNGIEDSAWRAIREAADQALDIAQKVTEGKATVNDLLKTIQKACTLAGLPYNSVKNILSGAAHHVQDIANGEFLSYESGVKRNNSTNYARLLQALENGDEKKAEKVRTELHKNDPDIEESTINSGLRKLIKEMWADGSYTVDEAVDKLIEYTGYDRDTAYWEVQKWVNKSNDEDASTSHYYRLYNVIDNGLDATDAIEELESHGKERKDIASNIKDHIKDSYNDGNITESEAIEKLAKYGLIKSHGEYIHYTEDEARNIVDTWKKSAELGWDYSDKAELLQSGQVSKSEMKKALMEVGGMTSEKADEWIAKTELGWEYDDKSYLYKSGKITSGELKSALMSVDHLSSEDADARIEVYDWNNEGYDVQVNQYDGIIEAYNTRIKTKGISKTIWYDYYVFKSKATGEVDANGKSIPYSKAVKIFAYIGKLNLTNDQKLALAREYTTSETTIAKYKTW